MTTLREVAGVVGLGVTAGALVAAGVAVRRRVGPDLGGAAARVVEAVVALAVLVVPSELLGAVGWLRPVPVVVAVVATTAAVVAWTRRLSPVPPPPPPPRLSGSSLPHEVDNSRKAVGVMRVVGVILIALVVAQWTARTFDVLGRGFADVDTLRYHLPFAARFARTGWVTRAHFVEGEALVTWFPATTELIHAVGIVLLRSDVLSVFANLGWLALALTAGWAVGAPSGVAPLTAGAVAAVAASPLLAITQPGTGANDVAVVALVVSAVAIVVHARGRLGLVAIAGAAAGLAVGSKLVALGAVGVLTVAVVAFAAKGVRRATLVAWTAPALVTGAFWYVRNLARTGNPVPWIEHLGPLRLPSPPLPITDATGYSIAHYATARWFWRDTFPNGMSDALGSAWPLLLLLAGGGAAFALVRGDGTARLVAVVALVAGGLYLVTPYSAGGFDGDPWLFYVDVRFAAPALVLGLVALVLATPRRATPFVAVGLAVVALAAHGDARPFPAWPAGGRAIGVVTGIAAALVLLRPRVPARRVAVAGVAVIAGVAALAALVPVDAYWRHHRYAAGGTGQADVYRWARSVGDERIAISGFAMQYPLYGRHLDNRVDFVVRRADHGGAVAPATCREWVDVVRDGAYRYVVTGADLGVPVHPPEEQWAARGLGARPILRSGAFTVFDVGVSGTRAAAPAGC